MNSDYGIALVTRALVLLIQEQVHTVFDGADIVCGHPRNFEATGRKRGVNIFLYQVVPNPSWRNHEVSILKRDRENREDRTKEKVLRVPVIPLNLYYVISFYGEEVEFVPHRLLALTMQALHDAPARLPDSLGEARKAFGLPVPTPDTLEDAELRVTQIEPIKLNPVQLNLEELSKLWSVFFQVPYALSVAYEASVVLLPMLKDSAKPMATMAALNRPDRAAAEAAEREANLSSDDADKRAKAAQAKREAAERAEEAADAAAKDAERLAALDSEREQLRRERDPWAGGPAPRGEEP